MKRCLFIVALTVMAVLPAFGQVPVASGQLQIQGSALTLAEGVTNGVPWTDADQVVNVGEAATVRTCFGGEQVLCGSVLPGDPRIAGLIVLAEFSGPELPIPIEVQTVPGGAFRLPSLQQEGDYVLSNIRLIESATRRMIGAAVPSTAILHVVDIVVESTNITALSLEDLEQRGIAITAENFQAYEFSFGFAFGEGEVVYLDLPVVFDENGQVSVLEKPDVRLENPEDDKFAQTISRWEPPRIVPFKLEVPESEARTRGEEADEVLKFPLFGAIVIPGNISFLNQFFEAQLVVMNGATQGVTLDNITGAIRLPDGNLLRLAKTEPSVAIGQAVPVVGANGTRTLEAGQQGLATWVVEGLATGTHVFGIDIAADIVRTGHEPMATTGRAQAAIEVVDARFHLTFSHPDVVREGEDYSLFATLTNLSRVPMSEITVAIDGATLTGTSFNPDVIVNDQQGERGSRKIVSLPPGASETLEFFLRAAVTGEVISATSETSSGSLGTSIVFHTGVGELGVPLSPATLVLPRFSERLLPPYVASDDFYRANMRLLGLGYSLAVAPAAMTPAGLPRVIKSDIERRAIDLAEAGERTFLEEGLLESLEVLALDQLGNRDRRIEMDGLRRLSDKGAAIADELGELIRAEQAARGLDGDEFFEHFRETTSYAEPFLAVLVDPTAANAAPVLEIGRVAPEGYLTAARSATAPDALRTLPYGEILEVLHAHGDEALLPFGLVGHVERNESFLIKLHNLTNAPTEVVLRMMVPDARNAGPTDPFGFRTVVIGPISIPAQTSVQLSAGPEELNPSQGGFVVRYLNEVALSPAPAASANAVELPPFRIIGAVQDYQLGEGRADLFGNVSRPNRYGSGITYLFNRPPLESAAENPANWAIDSTFSGFDVLGAAQNRIATNNARAAYRQDGRERVVAVRYSRPVAPMIDDGGAPLLAHRHTAALGGIDDEWENSLDTYPPAIRIASLPEPGGEPVAAHVGGLVAGKVLRGTGQPVAGVRVELLRDRRIETLQGPKIVIDLVGESTTGSSGEFYFDSIEEPAWDSSVQRGYRLRAHVPAVDGNPASIEEVGSVIRQLNRLTYVNIALLGRGTIRGRLTYHDSGQPVDGGVVSLANSLFGEGGTKKVLGDGSFEFTGIPVGPVSLMGKDPDGRRVYATVGLENPGDTVDVELRLFREPPPGFGTVTGRVLRQGTPQSGPTPLSGARIAIYANGQLIADTRTSTHGTFYFDDVPEGQVTLQASDWTVSRTPVITDLELSVGEVAEIDLIIPEGGTRAIKGKVQLANPFGLPQPIAGAVVFVPGPGNFAYTDAAGNYQIDDVPLQGSNEAAYNVTAIDYARKQQGSVQVVLTQAGETPLPAQAITLRDMVGKVRVLALDPLGRPYPGATVQVSTPWPSSGTLLEAVADSSGIARFGEVPVGTFDVSVRVGDGLQSGRVGYIGQGSATVVFGGHEAFATVQMMGAGVINVRTQTSTGAGTFNPVYYKLTYFSGTEYRIRVQGAYTETYTNSNGDLIQPILAPVGEYTITVFNALFGQKDITGRIDYPGQVKSHTVTFSALSTVRGRVVDVDGVTPVNGAEVYLSAAGLLPQKLISGAAAGQGEFTYTSVPQGSITLTTRGLVGTVERVAQVQSYLRVAGQQLDVTLRLKAQGSIRGRIVREDGSGIASAEYYVTEGSYPNRRLPAASDSWYRTDSEGYFELSHLYEGSFAVRARTSGLGSGYAAGAISFDWEVVTIPDIVLRGSPSGSIGVTVRDPDTGGPVDACQVRLSGEARVTDSAGTVLYDYLGLGTYSVYAFHAPSGRSGRVDGVTLSSNGQLREITIYLDQRGEVRGMLWNDSARSTPVGNATIRLYGSTVSGSVEAYSTTSPEANPSAGIQLGSFDFLGIPEGTFDLSASILGSPRAASAKASVTATSPRAEVDLILEPAGSVSFQVYERLQSGLRQINPDGGLFAVRVRQGDYECNRYRRGCVYDFNLSAPSARPVTTDPATGSAWTGNRYDFNNVLTSREIGIDVVELDGERRSAYIWGIGGLAGAGTPTNPYQIVLGPKGDVLVRVTQGGAFVPGANVTVTSSGGGRFPGVTGGAGWVLLEDVPAGNLSINVTAQQGAATLRGSKSITLIYDDQNLDVSVPIQEAVGANGYVYLSPANDAWDGTTPLLPAIEALVQIRDAGGNQLLAYTDSVGRYSYAAVVTGSYTLQAWGPDPSAWMQSGGVLSGSLGSDVRLPDLILDGSVPRVLNVSPPPGATDVSRRTTVEMEFSERLDASVLPSGASSPYFAVRNTAGQTASGMWASSLDALGRTKIVFTPNGSLTNQAVYGVTISQSVKDLAGRTLAAPMGWNFTTSDEEGPVVSGTVPALSQRIDPNGSIRIDFNEKVFAADGVLNSEAQVRFGCSSPCAVGCGSELPTTRYFTRSNFSIQVELDPYETPNDSRCLTVTGLEDGKGNTLAAYAQPFRIYDAHPPVLDGLTLIGEVSSAGELYPGRSYSLVPTLSSVDDPPAGDIARVEFFVQDPGPGGVSPANSATTSPYSYSFTAIRSGDGTLRLWSQAVDTSTNRSNIVPFTAVVLANQPPTVGSVAASALSPAAGHFYPGSSIRATVSGIADVDATVVTVAVQLVNETGQVLVVGESRSLARPASGNWAELGPQAFPVLLPQTSLPGTSLRFRARATDSQGGETIVDSAPFVVEADSIQPSVTSAAIVANGQAVTSLLVGQSFVVEAQIADSETGIASTSLALAPAQLFGSLSMSLVSGNLYRSNTLRVPPAAVGAGALVASITAIDRGGNSTTTTVSFTASTRVDSVAPVVEWQTPWAGAKWPAGHTSVVDPTNGAALLLAVRVVDRNLDGTGADVAGAIVEVQMSGPVRLASGAIELSPNWTTAVTQISEGTAAGEYRLAWKIPNGIAAGTSIPFAVRATDGALDTDGVSLRWSTAQVDVIAATPRIVYEAIAEKAVFETDPMQASGGDASGPVFLLDGTGLSIYPQPAGQPARSLSQLFVYAGGQNASNGTTTSRASFVTTPEVTSYSSSIPYYPLDLTIGSYLGVGTDGRIDVSGRGYLGGSYSPGRTLDGETPADFNAGGSHGGMGERGMNGQRAPGSVYGSIRNPSTAGGGGGAGSQNLYTQSVGGRGGGVLRILAPAATVRLVGSLFADGHSPVGTDPRSGGGAGGSIRLDASRLEGRGRISANGGHGRSGSPNDVGGGGGGRIAVRYGELAAGFDLATQLEARGGASALHAVDANGRWAGAGTIYTEWIVSGQPAQSGVLRMTTLYPKATPLTRLPAVGDARVVDIDAASSSVLLDLGRVTGDLVGERLVLEAASSEVGLGITSQQRISDPAGPGGYRVRLGVQDPAGALATVSSELSSGATVLAHGRARFASVSLSGGLRVATDDDLEIGGQLNPRAQIQLSSSARLLLRGEAPVLGLEPNPAAGSALPLGSSVAMAWTAYDPLGILRVQDEWTFDTTPGDWSYGDQPIALEQAASLSVPSNAAPGEARYRLTVTNIAGRVSTAVAAWEIPQNNEPTVQRTLLTPVVRRGQSFSVEVRGFDVEGLAALRLNAISGPVPLGVQSVAVSGANGERIATFLLTVLDTANVRDIVELQAEAVDAAGALSVAPLSFEIAADSQAPTVQISLSPAPPEGGYASGTAVTIAVVSSDDARVASTRLLINDVERAISSTGSLTFVWNEPPASTPRTFAIRSESVDPSGNRGLGSYPPVTIQPANVAGLPAVAITCPGPGAMLPSGYSGAQLAATYTDDSGVTGYQLVVDGVAMTPVPIPGLPKSGQVTTTAFLLPSASAPRPVVVALRIFDVADDSHYGETAIEILVTPTVSLTSTSSPAASDIVVVSGAVTRNLPVTAAGMIVLRGATLTTDVSLPGAEKRVDVSTTGLIYVECGGSINVSGKGYAAGQTYPFLAPSSDNEEAEVSAGGSHFGEGSVSGSESIAWTYDDVREPWFPGGGGAGAQGGRGGGVIRLHSDQRVTIDGSLSANGLAGSSSTQGGGAGGGIWLSSLGTVAGKGSVTATGGGAPSASGGGGGGVAIHTGTPVSGILPLPIVDGGRGSARIAGPGSVYLQGTDLPGGKLFVDGANVLAWACRLPGLGTGSVIGATGGRTITTSRAKIESFFAGHYLDVVPANGGAATLWRIESIANPAGQNAQITLEPGAAIAVGDSWSGVHRFEELEVRRLGKLTVSNDVIRVDRAVVAGDSSLATQDGTSFYSPIDVVDRMEISGTVRALTITGNDLLLHANSTLSRSMWQPLAPLTLMMSGNVTFESGARIDMNYKGYGENGATQITFDSLATSAATNEGGNHIGQGGVYGSSNSPQTYGSVYRPAENGSTSLGSQAGDGGGVVRAIVGNLIFQGSNSISANGANATTAGGGAGGSIWIEATGNIAGVATIQANGGTAPGGGGGGAVTASAGGTIGSAIVLKAVGGAGWDNNPKNFGAPGSVLVRDGTNAFGSLSIGDSFTQSSRQTLLPSLGSGIAQASTSSSVLVTSSGVTAHRFFVGHWIQIFDPEGNRRGIWRVEAIEQTSNPAKLRLEENEEFGPPIVVFGDVWSGTYRFDSIGGASAGLLASGEPIAGWPRDNQAPKVNLTFSSGSNAAGYAAPGESIGFVLTAADPEGLFAVFLRATGPASVSAPVISMGSVSKQSPFTLAISPTAQDGDVIEVIGVAVDKAGAVSLSTAIRIEIVAGGSRIVSIEVLEPRDAGFYRAGEILRLRARVWSGAGVVETRVGIENGASQTTAGAAAELSWPVPEVAEDSSFEIVAEATDSLGTMLTARRTIQVLGADGACAAGLDWHPIPLGELVNYRLQDMHSQWRYGEGGVSLGGVPFDIPIGGKNIWHSQFATGVNPRKAVIPVEISGVREVHTLINTWGGSTQTGLAWLELRFSNGTLFRKDLIGNNDIRDFYVGSFTTQINGVTTINVSSFQSIHPNQNVLDKQKVVIPIELIDSELQSVTLVDMGADGVQRTFLAGLTVLAPIDDNSNMRADACDIARANSTDCDANGVPDEVDLDSGWLPIDLSNVANGQPGTWANAYPRGPIKLGGVPFSAPVSGNRVWSADAAAPNSSSAVSMELLVGEVVSEVDTVVNTAWGKFGGPYAYVDFYWGDGVVESIGLYTGVHIRDAWGGLTSTVNLGYAVPASRYDIYDWDKQAFRFASPRLLNKIRFRDLGAVNQQRLIVWGVSVRRVADVDGDGIHDACAMEGGS